MDKTSSDPDTAAYCSENYAHHPVRNKRVPDAHEEILEDSETKGDYGGAVYGAEHERAAHYLVGHGEKQQVARVGGYRHRYGPVRGEIYKRAHAGQTSHHHLVRKNAGRESDGVNHQTNHNHHVVLRVYQQIVVSVFLKC